MIPRAVLVSALSLFAACSAAAPRPKTAASMLAARLSVPGCRRTCPVGQEIAPVEPQGSHVLQDCCLDPNGLSWSACAWNAEGRFMTLAELMAPERVAAAGCGGDGFPDCNP